MKRQLNYKKYGSGPPLVIAHGLFGMLDNWQTVAKKLAEEYEVIAVDQRNHGRSFHDPRHDYMAMSEDVIALADELGLDQFHLLGHSMGGKMACQLALNHAERLRGLVVVDILPMAYERGHDTVLKALTSAPVRQWKSRKESQEDLSKRLGGDLGTALFLLKSLKRSKEGGFEWRFNLSVLDREYDQIRVPLEGPVYEKPALFIKGDNSEYIGMTGWLETLELFPNADLETIEDAGHWVHADQPEELVRVVREFLHTL